jgi:4-amino-4-deoxy-L-arabinose transferase-like glycosyltransferase
MQEAPGSARHRANPTLPAATNRLGIQRALCVVLAALAGLGLMVDSLWRSSATYDEVMYLQVAARWWRTGEQIRVTRAGSPLTFWKLQQVPMLWTLDLLGYGPWIDDPKLFEAQLLPLARISALWIWLSALGLVACWSHRLYGPRAMVLASLWFAMSPNLLAHGPLVTMELPILATITAMALLFWEFLRAGSRRAFVASAAVGGLAFSCKFTAAIAPPIFGLLWLTSRWVDGDRRPARLALTVAGAMAGYVAIMGLSDVIITGGAMLPISNHTGSHPSLEGKLGRAESWVTRLIESPIPQDWSGFVRQALLQRGGTSSYLFGETRGTGWRYYYLVTLAVKVPLTFWLIMALRSTLGRRIPTAGRGWMLPAVALAFVAVASLGSTRNLGYRYLLPIAPLAIVWISGLAEGPSWARRLAWCGLAAQVLATASIHPYELSYFNALAGGPIGGRRMLSDSNLDWSQGIKPLAELQRAHPEYRDLTLFFFGDTEAGRYGVLGRTYTVRAESPNAHLPKRLAPETTYVGVSASLQWGPWGPLGYFRALDGVQPVCYTPDTTIAIYRTADIPRPGSRADEPPERAAAASKGIRQ